MALAGLYLVERISSKPYAWLGVLQVYSAYALAVGSNSSCVLAALVSVIAFSEGTPKDKKPHVESLAPLDHWAVYLPFTILFLLSGWQVHIPFSINFVLEGSLGLLLGVLITWLVGKITNQATRSFVDLLASGLYLGTFLFAALTLWPKHLMQNPWVFFIALTLAVFALLLSAALLRGTKEI